MNRVFFRKRDQVWVYAFKSGGKWCQKSVPRQVTTKREAKAWGDQWYAIEASFGRIHERRFAGDEPSIKELAERWTKLRKADADVKHGTVSSNRSHLNQHILPLFGNRRIPELSISELRVWVRGLKASGEPQSTHNACNTFSALVRFAMAEELTQVAANPLHHPGVRAKLPRLRRNVEDVLAVTLHFARVLLAASVVPWISRAIYAVAFLTGMRPDELFGLVWGDCDLKASPPFIKIDRGYKLASQTLDSPKTEAGRRTIPLHPSPFGC